MNDQGIRLRRVEPDDGPAVVELRRRVADIAVAEKNHLDFWQWENLQNPYGQAVALAAFSGGEAVCHTTALARKLLVHGRPLICRHFIESMTDSRHRGSLVFMRLLVQLQRELEAAGAEVLFCFPNANSRESFRRGLRWEDAGAADLRLYPLRPDLLARGRLPWIAGLPIKLAGRLHNSVFRRRDSREVEEGGRFDDSFTGLIETANQRGPVTLERNVPYLNWRYFEVPRREYRILRHATDSGETDGYLVYRRLDHEGLPIGVVMDLQAAGDPIAATLLCAGLYRLADSGAAAVFALTMPGDPLRSRYSRCGFVRVPARFNPNPFHLTVKALSGSADREVLLDGRNWRLSFGDNDVF